MKKVLLLGGTGLVGQAIYQSLKDTYQVVVTAGHQKVEGGWQLKVEEPARLCFILDKENPDIVIDTTKMTVEEAVEEIVNRLELL